MNPLVALALAIALILSIVALRALWTERRRSAARVQALAADIHGGMGMDAPTPTTLGLGTLGLGIAAVLLTAVGISSVGLASRGQTTAAAPATAATPTSLPLELLALEAERADDSLRVRGRVRNPSRGREVDHLTAVIMLFNQQGSFLTSGRGLVQAATVSPGADTTFTVTIPGAADAGRYRVSFRTDDRVLLHVDRRSSQ